MTTKIDETSAQSNIERLSSAMASNHRKQQRQQAEREAIDNGTSYSAQWCQTFIYGDGPRRTFINLSGLIKHPEMLKDPAKYVFQDNITHGTIINIDGFPHSQIREKFSRACLNTGNNISRLYMLLNQIYRAEAIKILWPEIYTLHQNTLIRRKNNRERAEYLQTLKLIPKEDRDLHKQCAQVTQNMSYREAARSSRVLI